MKKVLSVAMLILLNHLLFSQPIPKKDWYIYDLKGKVKEVIDTKRQLIREIPDLYRGEFISQYRITFNEQGFVRDILAFTANGDIQANLVAQHDEQGRTAGYIAYDSMGSAILSCKMYYDSKGDRFEEQFFNSNDSILYWFRYAYDSKGNDTLSQEFNSWGMSWSKTVYRFDENNNFVESIFNNGYDKVIRKVNTYGSHGFISKTTTYNEHNFIVNEVIFKYTLDSLGNWVKMVATDQDSSKVLNQRNILYY